MNSIMLSYQYKMNEVNMIQPLTTIFLASLYRGTHARPKTKYLKTSRACTSQRLNMRHHSHLGLKDQSPTNWGLDKQFH